MLTDKQVEDARERINVKIHDLRKQIRRDAKDYKVFFNTPSSDNRDLDEWFMKYLCNEIMQSVRELKELVEDKNE